MINLVGHVPDDFVPENYTVLYDIYSPFVTRLVTRYNRVQANFEDLLQHVWMKLIEVSVIQKYHASSSLPKKLTALEACTYLQISWQSWKRLMQPPLVEGDQHLVSIQSVSKVTKEKVLHRDHGVCHCCGHDMIAFAESFEKLKNDPLRVNGFKKVLVDLNLSSKQKTFWYAEKIDVPLRKGVTTIDRYQTTCFLCLRNSTPVVHLKSDWVPTSIEGSWDSKTALYSRESIERFKLERASRGKTKSEEVCQRKFKSKPFFKLYLARAVHNIYANWCRTRSRRYKEHFPGTDPETGRSWEDTLVSSMVTQDVLAELHEAVKILVDSNEVLTQTHEEVIVLLAKGCTPEEIVVRLGLPRHGLKTLLPGS